jgi:F-type H+-transporting ATPase subunit b
MELLTPQGGTIFWTAVTFAILLIILGKLAWRPILEMLDEREKKISESLEQAEIARAEAEKTMAEQNKIIEAAKKEAQEILNTSRNAADSTKEEIVQKAKQEADQLLNKAKREIELSRDKAIEEIRDLAVELSMTATTKLIGKSLDEKEHKALIEQSIKNIGDLN